MSLAVEKKAAELRIALELHGVVSAVNRRNSECVSDKVNA
jgi:hypothetical protein